MTGEAAHAAQAPSLMDARIHSISQEAEDILLFDIRPPRGQLFPEFEPGSHIDLHLANGLSRSYSLVNPPGERARYLVAVKNEVSGRGGSRFIHGRLRVGERLRIGGPRNNFRLREDASHSVFVAGGIGITPIYSMIQRLEKSGRSWELHYAAADRERAAFVPWLEALGSRTHFYFNAEQSPQNPPLKLQELIETVPQDSDLYCCGPSAMLAAFGVLTKSRPAERVHVEHFAAQEAPATAGGFEVVLHRSGDRVNIDAGETILDALIKKGIEVPYSCMEGVCGSCQVRVIDGTPDHRDLILTDQERERNDTMLICCSGSKSARLVLDL